MDETAWVKPTRVDGFHNMEFPPCQAGRRRGWALIQLGESTTHQPATLQCPAQRSSQNVAPGPQVTCVVPAGVCGRRLGSDTAFDGAQGFPAACVPCDLSSLSPSVQWGCRGYL